MKNRRHDFNIKPVTSAIDRIERELYGREDWLEKELKSVLPFEYNNGNIPHTNSTPLNSEKEYLHALRGKVLGHPFKIFDFANG